jgi:hypothetical protein
MEVDVFEALERDVDRLLGLDAFSYSDQESMITMARIAAKVECAKSLVAVGFDDGGEWAADGAQTSVAWIDTRCHVAKTAARRELRLGRALSHMPATAAAWSEGAITAAQVEALTKLFTARTKEAFVRDEQMLVDQAKKMKFGTFYSVAAYWEQCADPDGASEHDMARVARRDVWLVPGTSGMWSGQMNLDHVSGSIVAAEHSRLEKELFEADWAKAKAELGREPKLHELCRTAGQRRADALKEMAMRSATTPADGRRPRPLVTFHVGWETLHGRLCQLGDGQVVAPDTVLGWLLSADFERAVFAPGTRVEVSPTARLFTGATRRAIELRDKQCAHAYCDVAADQCQIDHIVDFAKGGPTTQENGRVLCGFHNRLKSGRRPPDDEPD